MEWMKSLFKGKLGIAVEAMKSASDEKIMESAGGLMRYCAVSAFNGTISSSGNLSFKLWLDCCDSTWVARVSKELGVSKARIHKAVRVFAQQNAHRERELEAELSGPILKPGQSMSFQMKAQIQIPPNIEN